jgi:predicted Rdx family selenoprotein
MPKFVIERTVPGAGERDAEALANISGHSNEVLRTLGPDIQWVHSYVVDDKIFCIYHAADEALIREHGHCGGFPVDSVYQIRAVIDPATAESAA